MTIMLETSGPSFYEYALTHWGVGSLTTIGSDNGLSPGWRQAIIWANAGMLLIGPLWTNFSEILIKNPAFSFKKMHLKVSSTKRRSFCLGLNVLTLLITVEQGAPLIERKKYNNNTQRFACSIS